MVPYLSKDYDHLVRSVSSLRNHSDCGHSMFSYEAVWPEALGLTENISIPGLSPLYPAVYCNPSGEICQFTTGEAEINAACTVMVSSTLPRRYK